MKYWIATTKDSNEITEKEYEWQNIKNNIKELGLNNDGQIISLPKNMRNYTQAKTASADLGGGEIQIESRYISGELGNNIIKVRVDEKSNNISIEVETI